MKSIRSCLSRSLAAITAAAAVTAILAGPQGARAAGPNLAPNPTFGANIAPWMQTWGPQATIAWDAGTALVTSEWVGPSPNWINANACVPTGITPNADYLFSAGVYMASGQSRTGATAIYVNFMDAPNCGGGIVAQEESPILTAYDSWQTANLVKKAPQTAKSAVLHLEVLKDGPQNGTFAARFDNVYFGLADAGAPPTSTPLPPTKTPAPPTKTPAPPTVTPPMEPPYIPPYIPPVLDVPASPPPPPPAPVSTATPAPVPSSAPRNEPEPVKQAPTTAPPVDAAAPVAPLPPETGSGAPIQRSHNLRLEFAIGLFGLSGVAYAMSRRKR